MKKIPFIASLLREARIIETSLPNPACTDPNGYIYLDPEQMEDMDFSEKAFTLAHEVMHCANFHAERAKNKDDKKKWNYATDCNVDHLLSTIMSVPDFVIRPETIVNTVGSEVADIETVENMSDMEIYSLLEKHYDYRKIDQDSNKGERSSFDKLPDVVSGSPMYSDGDEGEKGDLSEEDLEEEKDGEVIQEGGKFNDEEKEERREQWERNIAKAATQQKLAGKMSAGLKRYVDDILKPDIDVKSLIKQQLHNGLGNLVINNWSREGRKNPKLPGTKMLTTPTIWAMIDTSGSISKEELKIFLGAVYEFTSRADVAVVPWDAEAYEIVKANSKGQVLSKIAKSLKGGGGTKILPALKRVFGEMDNRDIVCALTDGGIFDIDERETQDYLMKVKKKSSTSFICTTRKKLEADGWNCLKMGKQ